MDEWREPASREDILRHSRLLRDWSTSLRAWSASARLRSEQIRKMTHSTAAGRARDAVVPVPVPVTEPGEPSLGEVPVTDLFVILVENHDFEVREAVRRLMLGMLAAGYPAENETVAASDAMDILEAILDEGSG